MHCVGVRCSDCCIVGFIVRAVAEDSTGYIRAITSGSSRNTWISVINFVRGATGCYDPLVRVKPGLALRRDSPLGSPWDNDPPRRWMSPTTSRDPHRDECHSLHFTTIETSVIRPIISYSSLGVCRSLSPLSPSNYWNDCIVVVQGYIIAKKEWFCWRI